MVGFRVLGPLEIVVGGRAIPVDSGKQRTLLAALLLQANRTVSLDELADKLWDGDGPSNVRSTIQKYVMRVRRQLVAAGLAGDVVRTEPGGYRMIVSPGLLDLHRFLELAQASEQAVREGDRTRGSALLAEALGMWNGVPPLANVPSVSVHRHEAAALTEQYLHALDRRIELDLERGLGAELLAELTGLTRRWPHRERFWAQRMRALHRSGRQGEALLVYREVTRLLAEDLGVDPGAGLRAAHREILAVPSRPRTVAPGPRQLPRPDANLVGRDAELAEVVAELGDAPVVITGMLGVGKTALAVHAAHRAACRFPDGQLYADLRGPVEEVLERFLLALGTRPEAVPADRETRVLAYRSLLAGRRMLVVLDDATDATQVRDLLPGTPGSAVLVTSRHELSGLLVSPGARRIRLGALSAAQAHRLLGRTDAAATDLIGLCGGLPLALRIAAVHLSQHPDLDLAAYVEQVRDEGPAALHIHGDDQASLPAALDRSYAGLSPQHRRLLALIGQTPPGQLSADHLGTIEPDAAFGLEALAATNLLDRLPNQHYRMHPLIRAYARARRPRTLSAITGGRSA